MKATRVLYLVLAVLLLLPVALMAQEGMEEPAASLWDFLVQIGVVGALTNLLVQGTKKLNTEIEKLPNLAKQVIAVVYAEVVTLAGNAGFTLPGELSGYTEQAVTGLLAGGFAMGLFSVMKALGWQKGDRVT